MRKVGEEVDKLLDVALECDGGVDESVVAKRFGGAEVASPHVDLFRLRDPARDLQ